MPSTKSSGFGESGTGKPRVLDLGCGNGAQTIVVAKRIDGVIMAVDNHQPYLDELQRRARIEGVSNRIRVCPKDMRDLGFTGRLFDLIWSEGALFVMGFRGGLLVCHSLLVPEGLLAVTEPCWLRSAPPAKCWQYFADMYPPMVDVDTNLATIERCGYGIVEYFILPESAWWESYCNPLEERLQLFRKKHAAESRWSHMINAVQMEIDLYREYPSYYGYVFYLMQRS